MALARLVVEHNNPEAEAWVTDTGTTTLLLCLDGFELVDAITHPHELVLAWCKRVWRCE